jgi:translocation and assembly module TamB
MSLRIGRVLRYAFAGIALLGLAATVALRWQVREGRSFLADFLSRTASSPTLKVEIGAFEDPLSAHPSLRDISLADKDGVWLTIDRVAVDWSPLALLALRVDVESVAIGHVDVARRPAPAPAAPATRGEGGGSFSIPELPVRVRLGRLALGELSLGEPVLGAAAKFAATASAALGGRADGAQFEAKIERLDAPGLVAAKGEMSQDAKALRLSLAAQEPAGGAIARLAALPGLPPVDISVTGEGTLDDFAARLSAAAGETIGAEGDLRLARKGAARRLELDLSSRIEPLLPKAAASLFAGATRIAGAATIGDDGAMGVERMEMTSSALRLDVSGHVDAAGAIAADLSLVGLPAAADAAFRAETLTATAHVAGSRAQLDFSGSGQGAGLGFADRALADAIGDTFSFTLRGRATADGNADIAVAEIETGAAQVAFVGRAGPDALDGKADVSAPNLARFARLAGRDLRGALALAVGLRGVPKDGRITATLDGGVTGPATGVAALDGLLGRRLALSGAVAALGEGGLRVDALSIRGDHLRVLVGGTATKQAADVSATVDIPDLHAADHRLTGRADVALKLIGSLEQPHAIFDAAVIDMRAAGHAIPRLALHGDARDLTGALAATATLEGTIDGNAARGKLSVAKAGDGWTLDGLDLAIGRAALKGAVALDAQRLASGRLSLAAPDLDDLSALALQKLSGALRADIALESVGGGQNVAIDAKGERIRAEAASIERLSAKISGRDLLRRPALDGELAIDAARVGAETIAKARLLATPQGAATALDLSVEARGFAIAGKSVLTPGEETRLDIQSLSAQRAGRRIALAGPATVRLAGGGAELKDVSFALGSGRLDVNGSAGERLDLSIRARAVPLSIAAIADASLALDGKLDAEARIVGAAKAPSGDWKVKVAKLSAPQLRANGLPALDIAAYGALSGGRTTLDADIALGPAGRVAIAGSAPIDAAGALDLGVKGQIDAKLADTALAANGQTLRGKAAIDLRVAGSVPAPALSGAVTLSGGSFADPLNGVNLDHIEARLEGHGRELAISRLTALTKNGGQLAATGRVTIAPEAGMPGSIRIAAKNAQLVASELVTATVDLDLDVSGPLARAPKVGGRVTLDTMDVNVPDRLPASLRAPPGSTHISPGAFAKQMLALERKEKERAGRRTSFDATLDLTIAAPNRIFVRGRGIDAEFGGELKLGGSIQKPVANGAFELRRGKLQLLTQRIDITRGKLAFAGGLVPQLDFSAETTASDVTAKIGVSGPASAPTFSFSSSPELPQDEVLSRLLFAKASGSLSAFQALQLATALAQFSGAGTGVDAFEKMRRALGVDTLDLEAGGSSGPTVGASRYISDNISVGVRTGTKPEQAAVSVGVDVTKNVHVKGETRMDGKTSVGVGVEWEY